MSIIDTLPPISRQIWDAKYRLKGSDGSIIDHTVEMTWMRVAAALAAAEKPEEQAEWATRFYSAMEGFKFIPAGRILAGAGTARNVTLMNCYVMGTIPDSLDGIFSHLREAALTMQQGGGIGYDFSTLRPKGALVKGVDADASGPLSFMDVWDSMCKTLMSAGARRGAMMAVMRCDHPDIFEFVEAKRTKGRLTQFNMSVLVADEFINRVKIDGPWALVFNGVAVKTVVARDLWDAIMRSTYGHAEPGVIFIDRVNAQNNLSYCETIASTNPCFSADTLIVTDQGAKRIIGLVGQTVRVWDGDHWVTIDNFRVTGHDQKMLRITLQDGASLRVTPQHTMILADGREIPASELTTGDKLRLSDVEYDGELQATAAYLKGFLLGDGSIIRNRPMLYLYEPKYGCIGRLIASALQISELVTHTNAIEDLGFVEQVTDRQTRLAMMGLCVRGNELRDWCSIHKEHLPDEVFCWNRPSKLELITGLFDADGTHMDTENGFGYQLSSVHRNFLCDVQTLLKGIGVRSKISLMKAAGVRELPGGTFNTQDCWRLTISQTSSIKLSQQTKFARLISFADRTTKYNVKSRAGAVVSIVEDGVDELVYCCTVPVTHRLSLGIGITTGQCGEQPLPPYGSCDLGSINLAALVQNPFTDQAFIDANDFEWIVPLAVRMLDNVYDVTRFPLAQQRREGELKRRIGLGVTGLANALVMCGYRYGTQEAAEVAASWMQSIEQRAYFASAELAEEKGAFPLFDREAYGKSATWKRLPTRIRGIIHDKGLRNSHLMSVAPTGTISLFAGNVSSGVEPPFAYRYTRKVLQPDGTKVEEAVEDYAYALFKRLTNVYAGEPKLPPCFVTAQDLSPGEHLLMLAAVQMHCDTSVSKTINLPRDISFEDFKDVYIHAHLLGCKSCTTYRPNDVTGSVLSVEEQPKAIMNADEKFPYACPDLDQTEQPEDWGQIFRELNPLVVSQAVADDAARQGVPLPEGTVVASPLPLSDEDDEPEDLIPVRPEVLIGKTYKVRWTDGVSNHAYYVTINDGPDGPFEVFINSKCVESQAWIAALTRMISAVFRRGGDLRFVAEELEAVVDPKGGSWIDGSYVPSLPSLIGQVIRRHLSSPLEDEVAVQNESGEWTNGDVDKAAYTEVVNQALKAGKQCPKCGAYALARIEGCENCLDCGWSRCG